MFSFEWERKDSGIWWLIWLLCFCALEGKHSQRLNEALILWAACQEDEKTLEQTASGDGGDEGLLETGTANVIIRPSLSSPLPSFFLQFFFFSFYTFTLLYLTDKHSPSVRQPQPLCVLWSGKTGPLSPVSGYWHTRRSRLGGEGSANGDLSLFWHLQNTACHLPDNCAFDLQECRMAGAT